MCARIVCENVRARSVSLPDGNCRGRVCFDTKGELWRESVTKNFAVAAAGLLNTSNYVYARESFFSSVRSDWCRVYGVDGLWRV